MATAQGKGPVVRKHQPSLDHDNPLKGKPVNAHSNITADGSAASFPIPYPNQDSYDELEDILAKLRILSIVLTDGRGCDGGTAQDLGVIVNDVTDRLYPILIHLRNVDGNDRSRRYQQARRTWLSEHGSGA